MRAGNATTCAVPLRQGRAMQATVEARVEFIEPYFGSFPRIRRATYESGSICLPTQRERFPWLMTPRSTTIQVSLLYTAFAVYSTTTVP